MGKNKLKTQSISSALAKKFGGKWKYFNHAHWACDDGIRYVRRVATGTDFNGEYTGETMMCMYYNDGTSPEWIYGL